MSKLVIGFVGGSGSGKTTIADGLVKATRSTMILPFAQPLKDFARLFGWNGIKDTKGRRLLQLLGTECGRECIDPDLWVKKWQEVVKDTAQVIIADDIRFQNEADAVAALGGVLIFVHRKTAGVGNHSSELELKSIRCDFTLDNSGTIEESVDTALRMIAEYEVADNSKPCNLCSLPPNTFCGTLNGICTSENCSRVRDVPEEEPGIKLCSKCTLSSIPHGSFCHFLGEYVTSKNCTRCVLEEPGTKLCTLCSSETSLPHGTHCYIVNKCITPENCHRVVGVPEDCATCEVADV